MDELLTCSWAPGGIPAPSFLGRAVMLCPATGVLPVPAGPPSTVRLQLLLSHIPLAAVWGCSRVSLERAAPTTRVWSVLWDIPCGARHNLPMAGAGFGPGTGLSPCSRAQMRCSPHLEVSFPELAACSRGTQRCQLGVTCTRCFPGFLPRRCTPDSVRGNGLGFLCQLFSEGWAAERAIPHAAGCCAPAGH